MESNARFYHCRAVEERIAAQRAVTERARDWHSKLSADFAERAAAATSVTASRHTASASAAVA